MKRRIAADEMALPTSSGGIIRMVPAVLGFPQGPTNPRHDRLHYRRIGGARGSEWQQAPLPPKAAFS